MRVNDRGPFLAERIIDISKAAATTLDMIADGFATVRIHPVTPRSPESQLSQLACPQGKTWVIPTFQGAEMDDKKEGGDAVNPTTKGTLGSAIAGAVAGTALGVPVAGTVIGASWQSAVLIAQLKFA